VLDNPAPPLEIVAPQRRQVSRSTSSACRMRAPQHPNMQKHHAVARRPNPMTGPVDRGTSASDAPLPTSPNALHEQTRSPSYARALAQLHRYASLDGVPVLLEGETGTGKTWFARMLHVLSPRTRRPFYQVNLAALEDALASSDLFGHLSGAFTGASQRRAGYFASAEGGTLFLDEIGQSSLAIQRKLLHAIEYGEMWPVGADRAIRVDVRVIAGTNRPPASLVEEGRMLHDIVPRLSAFRIRIPSLRERREDIALLARAIVVRDASRYGAYAMPPAIAPELARRLEREDWPGNVRELEGVMRRMLVDACGDAALTETLLDGALDAAPKPGAAPVRIPADAAIDIGTAVRDGVPKTELARQLGISRATLYRRMRADASADSDAASSSSTIDSATA
jgi:DNA-binding NtrC family response regulator